MNKILLFGLCLLLAACNDTPKAPDVSNVEMRVEGIRYDRSFFEIDSNQLFDELSILTRTYPNFHADFMEQVLGPFYWLEGGSVRVGALCPYLSHSRMLLGSDTTQTYCHQLQVQHRS